MKPNCVRTCCLLAVAWAAVSVRSVRAEEALDAFPQSAAAVARVASADKLTGGIKEMLGSIGSLAVLGVPAVDRGLNEAFQIAGDGEAIDRTAPAYLAVFPLEDEREPVAWLVRAGDENKLQRAVAKAGPDDKLSPEQLDGGLVKVSHGDRDSYFGHFGEWIFYTHNEAVSKLLIFDRQQQPTFASIVAPAAKELLESGDGAVAVNAALLTKQYRDKLQEARERVQRQIAGLQADALGGGGSGTSNPEAVRKLYSDLATLAFDAADEAQWAVASFNFSSAGAGVSLNLGVSQDGKVDQLLAANPPVALETLGLLPAGSAVYYGYQANYEQLSNWLSDWLKTAYGDDPNGEKMNKAIEQMSQAGLGPAVGSFSVSAAAGVVAATMYQAERPDQLRSALAEYRAAGEAESPLFAQSTEFKPNAENYENHPIDVVTTKFKFKEVTDEGQRIGQKLVQKIFGGEQMTTRFASVEGLALQVTGNDAKHLRDTIDGLSSGERVLGLEEAFAKTRDRLGEQANLIALFNAPQLIVDFVGLIRDVPPFDMLLARAPFNFGARPAVSYAGLSLTAQPHAIGLQLFVPVEQPKGVLQIFGQGQ